VLADFAGGFAFDEPFSAFGELFAAPPELAESPEDAALEEEELLSLAAGFDSDGDDEVPPDSLLRAFLRDSDG